MHTVAPTIFTLLLGHYVGTLFAKFASNRATFLISPVAALQYMALLEPMHSKPLSGQQCFALNKVVSVNVYLRGDKSSVVPQIVSLVTGAAAALQTEVTSGSTAPSLSQNRPPFPLTAPYLVAVQRSATLNEATFGQQALNVPSELFTFSKLAPRQTSSN